MPSQLVKSAFGFRSFNDPKSKTKCVPLSVICGVGVRVGVARAPVPPYVAGPGPNPHNFLLQSSTLPSGSQPGECQSWVI